MGGDVTDISLEQSVSALAERARTDPASALAALAALESRAIAVDQPRAAAWAGLHRAHALTHAGRLDEALAAAELTAERMRALPDRGGEIETRLAIATVWGMRGDLPLSRSRFEEAIAMARSDGLEHLEGRALAGLAYAYGREGIADRYVALTREAIAILERVDAPRRLALAWANLGGGLTRLEQLDGAAEAYRRALDLARAHEADRVAAIATGGLGEIAATEDAIDRAERLFGQARAAFDALGRPFEALMQASLFGRILARRGHAERCVSVCEEALPGARAHGFLAIVGELHGHLAIARRALGDLDGAFAELEAAVDVERRLRARNQREHERRVEALREASDAARARERTPAVARLEAEVARLEAALLREQSGRDVLARQARTDPLTGLHNRRTLEALGGEEVRLARARGAPLALLAIDVDRFKALNDRYGYAAGDAALVALTRGVAATLRGRDLFARVGGEEFVVLLPDADAVGARAVAQRILGAVRATPIATAAGELRVTVSVGVAEARADEPLEALMERADRALYRAKSAGRDRVEIAT